MVVLCLLGALVCASPPNDLTVRVEEGAGAVVARHSMASRRFLVFVHDSAGIPLPQITVTFRLPAGGSSGRFASGMLTESFLTDAKGEAYVRGILWNDIPGKLEIRVTAASGERRAEASIPVEISSTLAAPPPPALHGSSSSRKWLIIAAVAAGAAVGVAAAAGKGSSATPAATPAPLVVAPSIGTPVISIGGPH